MGSEILQVQARFGRKRLRHEEGGKPNLVLSGHVAEFANGWVANAIFKLKQFFFGDTKPCRRPGYVKPSL